MLLFRWLAEFVENHERAAMFNGSKIDISRDFWLYANARAPMSDGSRQWKRGMYIYKIHNFARNPEVFFLKSSRSSTTELQESKQKLIIQISNVNDDLWLMATYDTCEAHKNPSKIIVCSTFIHKICSTNLHDERVSCLIFIWAMMPVKLEPVAKLLALCSVATSRVYFSNLWSSLSNDQIKKTELQLL